MSNGHCKSWEEVVRLWAKSGVDGNAESCKQSWGRGCGALDYLLGIQEGGETVIRMKNK